MCDGILTVEWCPGIVVTVRLSSILLFYASYATCVTTVKPEIPTNLEGGQFKLAKICVYKCFLKRLGYIIFNCTQQLSAEDRNTWLDPPTTRGCASGMWCLGASDPKYGAEMPLQRHIESKALSKGTLHLPTPKILASQKDIKES